MISILLTLASFLTLLLILGLFMKKEHYVKREIIINAPSQKVFDFLRLLQNQEKFNKWAKAGSDRKWEYKGTDGTVGYMISWKGNKDAGQGEKEIINIVEGKRIETEIRFVKPFKVSASVIMETEALAANYTKVNLINAGKLNFPMNLMIPIAQRNFAKDMDESLSALKAYLERNQEWRVRPDFIATVTYLTAAQGGRKTPANSGYRPQFKIAGYEIQTSGEQIFIGRDKVMPGETADAEVSISSPEDFLYRLSVGQSFEFREGARVVATGKIIDIINEDLDSKRRAEKTFI